VTADGPRPGSDFVFGGRFPLGHSPHPGAAARIVIEGWHAVPTRPRVGAPRELDRDLPHGLAPRPLEIQRQH